MDGSHVVILAATLSYDLQAKSVIAFGPPETDRDHKLWSLQRCGGYHKL